MTDLNTQKIITDIRRYFERKLETYMFFTRVTAPLFVKSNTGINDNLNGIENPVHFHIPSLNCDAEIVHSLAKWKRMALANYKVEPHKGIYTNMNAIRKDEEILDELHSVYVDQWDWEMVIDKKDRTITYLNNVVSNIYRCIKDTYEFISRKYNLEQTQYLPDKVKFVLSDTLAMEYPDLSPKEREYEYMKSKSSNYATFIIGIGHNLSDGKPHDGRSPDYDDWRLNGDLLLFDSIHDRVIEISSMGIRVDKESLMEQLTVTNCLNRLTYDYHQGIINDTLPLTIGGGIGQSRLCMYILGKKHIKEVQESIWK